MNDGLTTSTSATILIICLGHLLTSFLQGSYASRFQSGREGVMVTNFTTLSISFVVKYETQIIDQICDPNPNFNWKKTSWFVWSSFSFAGGNSLSILFTIRFRSKWIFMNTNMRVACRWKKHANIQRNYTFTHWLIVLTLIINIFVNIKRQRCPWRQREKKVGILPLFRIPPNLVYTNAQCQGMCGYTEVQLWIFMYIH